MYPLPPILRDFAFEPPAADEPMKAEHRFERMNLRGHDPVCGVAGVSLVKVRVFSISEGNVYGL